MKKSKLWRLAAAGAFVLLSMAGCSDTLAKALGGGTEGEFAIILDPAVQSFVKVLQTKANEGELVMLFVTGDNSKNFRVINKADAVAVTHSSTGSKGADADTLERLGLGAGTIAMPFVFKMPKSDVEVKGASAADKTPDDAGVTGSPDEDPKNAEGKSMNNSLINLSVEGVDFTFQSPITNYNLLPSPVIADQSNVTVTATSSHEKAVISINGAAASPWTARETVTLNGPGSATTIKVKVTAEDKTTTVTYSVIVYRSASEPSITDPPGDPDDDPKPTQPGKNANLKWLEPLDTNKNAVSNVIVWPRVHADVETYELFTNDLTNTFDMRVYTADPQATVTITDAAGSYVISNTTKGNIFTLPQLADKGSGGGLTYGKGTAHNDFITTSKKAAFATPIKIMVTSTDMSTVKTYSITAYSYIGGGKEVPQARGGHIKFINVDGKIHEIHTFWDNKYKASDLKDTFAFITKEKPVETMRVLVQGGGGKGGQWTSAYYGIRVHINGGGGGAGGLVEERNFQVTDWSYSVVAGRGGLNSGSGTKNEDGQPSSFGSLQAVGGGGGWDGDDANGKTPNEVFKDRLVPPTFGGMGECDAVPHAYGGGGAKKTSGTAVGKDRDGNALDERPDDNRGGAGETSDISGANVTYGAGGHGGNGWTDAQYCYIGYGGNQDTITWDYSSKEKSDIGLLKQDYKYDCGVRRNGGPGRVIVRFIQNWDKALGK